MKKLLLGLLIVFCLTGVSLAQKGHPQQKTPQVMPPQQVRPQPPQRIQPQPKPQSKPQSRPNIDKHDADRHDTHPEYRHRTIYVYPYYNYYPYYYYPYNYPYYYPYYQDRNNIEEEERVVDDELWLRTRQGFVRNPVNDKLEWRYPGYWKQNEDKVWIYKRLKEWPLPGHWTNENGVREWKRDNE